MSAVAQRLEFEGLPECVKSGFPFGLHVRLLGSNGQTLADVEECDVCLELAEGTGELCGRLEECAYEGQADFFSACYLGPGPIQLRAVAGSASAVTGYIPVLKTEDELKAEEAIGGEEELADWLAAMDNILSEPGCTSPKASEVTEWMLLGGKPAAEDAMHSNSQCVTHLLNCCEPWCADGPNFERLQYAGFEAYDEPGYRLLDEHYATTAKPLLTKACAENGCCLVHCAMGVNRSALVCAAFLIDCVGMELLPVVRLLKQRRGCVLGNRSFRLQLLEFAAARGRLGSRSG